MNGQNTIRLGINAGLMNMAQENKIFDPECNGKQCGHVGYCIAAHQGNKCRGNEIKSAQLDELMRLADKFSAAERVDLWGKNKEKCRADLYNFAASLINAKGKS